MMIDLSSEHEHSKLSSKLRLFLFLLATLPSPSHGSLRAGTLSFSCLTSGPAHIVMSDVFDDDHHVKHEREPRVAPITHRTVSNR